MKIQGFANIFLLSDPEIHRIILREMYGLPKPGAAEPTLSHPGDLRKRFSRRKVAKL